MAPSVCDTVPGRAWWNLGASVRWVWNVCGLCSVGVGLVGAFVPVLPTTVFLIIGLWCFSKGSPRLEAWLLHHKVYGNALRRWRLTKAIPVRAKFVAVVAITVSVLVSAWLVRDRTVGWVGVLALGVAGVSYVLSRPTDRGEALPAVRDQAV